MVQILDHATVKVYILISCSFPISSQYQTIWMMVNPPTKFLNRPFDGIMRTSYELHLNIFIGPKAYCLKIPNAIDQKDINGQRTVKNCLGPCFID